MANISYAEVIELLQAQKNPEAVVGMARFGIDTSTALGINIPFLRRLARQIGPSHELAVALWDSGIREARILAAYVDRAQWVTTEQMDLWAAEFTSWDICDQVCGNLFDRTPYAYQKAIEWSHREEEFVRRAGFVMMATLAVHDKKADNKAFMAFFSEIRSAANDERNFVKKAVNWALRQIGKRNAYLLEQAIVVAEELAKSSSASSRWIAKDALREFEKRKSNSL